MLPHRFTNFEIQNYYQNEPKFSSAYSRKKLSKTRDGAYIINLDKYESIGVHWIAQYMEAETATYFDSSGVEHIPKEVRKFIGNKHIITSIYGMQAYNSIMY